MIKDNTGQISLEYLLIFAISLILLIAFTLPLAQMAIERTSDVSNTLNAKSELSKLSNAISQVYSEGHGSKQTVYLDVNENMYVRITQAYSSLSLKLSDGTYKSITLNHNSNLNSGGLNLDKGENKVIIEWPIGEEKMNIYKKY